MSKLSEQLRDLPVQEPPADGWSALQQRQQRNRRSQQAVFAGVAAAASLLLTLGLVLWQPPSPITEAPQPLAQLMQRSRELEQTLAAVRPQARSWDRQLASTAAGLQDELAVVDLQLNYAEDAGAERLWQNRVELMSQLVQTHRQAATQRAPDLNSEKEEYAL